MRERLATYGDIIGIFVVLLSLLLFFSIMSDNFFTTSNLFRILLNVSTIGIMALGECLVIIIGGLDLAVASVFAISGVLTGMLITKFGISVPLSILVGLLSGALIGAVNATLILYVGLASFIATFGMLSVIRGLAYAISGGYTIPVYTSSFTNIGMGYIGPGTDSRNIVFRFSDVAFYCSTENNFWSKSICNRRQCACCILFGHKNDSNKIPCIYFSPEYLLRLLGSSVRRRLEWHLPPRVLVMN